MKLEELPDSVSLPRASELGHENLRGLSLIFPVVPESVAPTRDARPSETSQTVPHSQNSLLPPSSGISEPFSTIRIDPPTQTPLANPPQTSPTSPTSPTSQDNDSDYEDGDGKKWVVNDPPKPRKTSESKRADNAKFDLWIEQNQQYLSKGVSKLVAEGDRSVNSLVREFENKRIITSPRDYQLELFELSKTQNTIAVLDTGTSWSLASHGHPAH